MKNRTRTNEEWSYCNGVITASKNNNRLIDFRNNLIQALPQDYAMIHGTGGKTHAANSTIGIYLCDYSKGTGQNSITVHCNVSPKVIDWWEMHVARIATGIDSLVMEAANLKSNADAMGAEAEKLYQVCMQYCGKGILSPDLEQILSSTGNVLVRAGEMDRKIAESLENKSVGFHYSQDKINPYMKRADGLCEVSVLTVDYQPIYNGNIQRNPWFVMIRNCYAPLSERGNGSINYVASQAVDQKECYVKLSTQDMWSQLNTVQRFISLWEQRFGGPAIEQGLARKEQIIQQERQANFAPAQNWNDYPQDYCDDSQYGGGFYPGC